MGISRGDIQFAYQGDPNNWTFEAIADDNGQPRLRGKSPDGIGLIDLSGPADNLTSVGIVLTGSRVTTKGDLEKIARHILTFCDIVMPRWPDCGKWVVDHLGDANLKEIKTIQGNQQLTLLTAPTSTDLTVILDVHGTR